MGPQFLQSFEPDGDALLRRISTHVDDATLLLIAHQDPIGGDSRRARFMNALRKLRAGGPLMRQSDFASREKFYNQDVTELLRFSCAAEPDTALNIQWRGTRGHWARAFAGAVMLRSYADPEILMTAIGNYNEAMMQLIDSVRSLDAGFEAEIMAALAWFIVHSDGDSLTDEIGPDQRAFAGVGILSFAVDSGKVSLDTVMKLSDWLIAEEQKAFDQWGESVGKFPHHWLFRTTFFDNNREKWMAIGADLAACNVAGPCGDAVRGVGQRLSGQIPMS
jgi:hypothetical protein